MTDNDISMLIKYKQKRNISRHELMSIEHLAKLNLIEIDTLYRNTVNNIIIYYAKTTDTGIGMIKMNKKKRFIIF